MRQVVKLVPVELDKPRHLRFDMNAFAAFEEAMGQNLFAVDLGQLSIRQVRALIWAGLLHEDKTLTIEQVGGCLMLSDIAVVAEKIREAFGVAVPEAEGGEASGEPFRDDADVGDSEI